MKTHSGWYKLSDQSGLTKDIKWESGWKKFGHRFPIASLTFLFPNGKSRTRWSDFFISAFQMEKDFLSILEFTFDFYQKF